MGFKPHQRRSKLESVSKLTNYIKSVLKKVRSIIYKSQEDRVRYYNQRYISVPVFCPSNRIFIDSSNIYTTCLSTKLLYYCLRPYIVEK